MASRKNGKSDPNVKLGAVYDRKVDRKLVDEDREGTEKQHLEACNAIDSAEAARKVRSSEDSDKLKELRAKERALRAALNSGVIEETVKVREHMYIQTGTTRTGVEVGSHRKRPTERSSGFRVRIKPALSGLALS